MKVVETQNLVNVLGVVDPTGKVAITTQKTECRSSEKDPYWTSPGRAEIPTGTALLVIGVGKNNFVKVIWEEKIVFVQARHLRLVEINNTFNNKSFAITGELSVSREYFKNLIKLKGGKFKSAIAKNTDYLIIGHPTRSNGSSTKLKKALQLGIEVITEQQFFNLIAEGK